MDKEKIYKGYKATDENMCCLGFQFELGKWYSCEGELVLCENGFHFCEYPSGPWSYYTEGRLFEIEAKEAVVSKGPGADLKHVARHIRLVKEINLDRDKNTGNRNTGNRNSGNGNTGNGNTGDGNVGDYHSGCLCMEPAPFFLFDIPASRDQADFDLIHMLSAKLQKDDPFDTKPFLKIENATKEKIKALHAAHIASRKELSK